MFLQLASVYHHKCFLKNVCVVAGFLRGLRSMGLCTVSCPIIYFLQSNRKGRSRKPPDIGGSKI